MALNPCVEISCAVAHRAPKFNHGWPAAEHGKLSKRGRREADAPRCIVAVEIAPEVTGQGLPLHKWEAYNRVYDQHSRAD